MKSFSLTYTGILVIVFAKLVEMSGIQLATEQLTNFVETGGVLIGSVISLYGRFRKGDLQLWGTRK